MSWRMGLGASLLVALVVVVAFGPVLGARALSLDDDDYITHNELVTQPSAAHAAQFFREAMRPTTVGGYWMPLSMTSLMLDVAQGGSASNPAPFHRTSLALHVAATVALFWLLALLFGAPVPALLAALAFGLHPLAVEPVAWIGERKTVLAGALALCAAAIHVAWVRYGGPWRRVVSWVAFALALLAKPTATLLPLMLLLIDHWPLQRLSKRAITEKWPFFLLAAASAVITVISHARSATLDVASGSDRVTLPLQASARLVFYAGKMLWPGVLSCVYPRLGPYGWTSPEALGALFAVVAMSALAVLWARRRPALLIGWGWFVLALAPVLGWFDYSWVTLSDKYCYLAIAGVAIVLAGALAAAWRQAAAWRMATAGLLGAVLFAEAATSRAAIARWSDSLTLWTHITAVAPNEPGAHSGLGAVLVREQRWPESRVAFERAAALDPKFWVAQVNVLAGGPADGRSARRRGSCLACGGADAARCRCPRASRGRGTGFKSSRSRRAVPATRTQSSPVRRASACDAGTDARSAGQARREHGRSPSRTSGSPREGDGALARALVERQASFARRRPWREPTRPVTR